MTEGKKKPGKSSKATKKAAVPEVQQEAAQPVPVDLPLAETTGTAPSELVIITGMSGSGKGSVLRALEDAGYYAVDNLPVELIPTFAELIGDSASGRRAALVIDIREGTGLKKFPAIFTALQGTKNVRLLFLEAADETIVRRFSETRRPHPLSDGEQPITESIRKEREALAPVRELADVVVDTSKFNVHELRDFIKQKFGGNGEEARILVYVTSFGFRHGLPADCDLVFDVRFLPNPHYIPKFKPLTGLNPSVAKYIRSFPQTTEFLERITQMLLYLLPHYIREGKSYLTVGFGCTGGHHRSVMMADQIRKNLVKAGYQAKASHRDIDKPY